MLTKNNVTKSCYYCCCCCFSTEVGKTNGLAQPRLRAQLRVLDMLIFGGNTRFHTRLHRTHVYTSSSTTTSSASFIFSGVIFGLGSASFCLHCAGGVCFETRGFRGEETHERKHLRPLPEETRLKAKFTRTR